MTVIKCMIVSLSSLFRRCSIAVWFWLGCFSFVRLDLELQIREDSACNNSAAVSSDS